MNEFANSEIVWQVPMTEKCNSRGDIQNLDLEKPHCFDETQTVKTRFLDLGGNICDVHGYECEERFFHARL